MGFLLFFFCWVPTLSLGKCTRLQNKQTAARLLFKYFLFAGEHNLKKNWLDSRSGASHGCQDAFLKD